MLQRGAHEFLKRSLDPSGRMEAEVEEAARKGPSAPPVDEMRDMYIARIKMALLLELADYDGTDVVRCGDGCDHLGLARSRTWSGGM